MNRRSLAGLVVVNVALLVVLAVLCLTPRAAQAQLGQGRGDYFMIAGQAVGQNAGVLYIVDTVSAKVIAVAYNKQNRTFAAVAERDINNDAKDAGR
jgi:hypothetical protein